MGAIGVAGWFTARVDPRYEGQIEMDISERNFEETIETALLEGGPDALPDRTGLAEPRAVYGSYIPGGFRKRPYGVYDPVLCLDPDMTIAFIQATQPKKWAELSKHHGNEAKERFLQRLSAEIAKRGTLDVFRKGIKDMGVGFELAYFRPSSGLNPDLQTLYEANMFSVIRQLRYSTQNSNSIDTVLFLNGIPIFTAELKNPLNGQNYEHAITQYRRDRDPKEPLLSFGRCLVHFAVDPEWVFATTHLEGEATRFLPFNKGKYGGAGNPPDLHGFATRYLWEHVWSKDSIIELIQRFIHVIEEEDDKGRKTGRKSLMFPRYHQLDAVRRLVEDARRNGTGQRYLIQHSAGSGKSNSIAWLAHQLSILHDIEEKRVFDSIIVITDRKVLDRQLQRTVRQFQQTLGVVENIDKTSRQLKDALESGKTIIVTTLQKFPVIVKDVRDLPGKRFAVIIDEAHSSQSGEKTGGALKRVLAAKSLEDAEREDEVSEPSAEDRIAEVMSARGPLPNASMFAFTATPKQKTLELFGNPRPDGGYEPFSLYSMRQAIDEGFIMDVLENYTTHRVYWSLLKKIADDPRYDRARAQYVAKLFVDLHPHAINEKVNIIAEHFHDNSAHRIGGRAKAMVVTRSRLHAVLTAKALRAYLEERGYPFKVLAAFSGTVVDGALHETEAQMNGFSESQTATVFKQQDYRFLVVAEKFQTGFDESLLHTMYVDKRLQGLNAVQTLSRLNRVHPEKQETMVLDFANEAGDIQKAFEPYYEKTILSEGTDPNLLYDHQRQLLEAEVFDGEEVDAFAEAYFSDQGQNVLYRLLADPVGRFLELPEEQQSAFKSRLASYRRLYAFLTQVARFVDADLEKLYIFARYLLLKLKDIGKPLPVEIQRAIDIESFKVQQTSQGSISLSAHRGELKPMTGVGPATPMPERLEPLSEIIRELNERFGTTFEERDRVFVEELLGRLAGDPSLEASLRANTPANARLTFDHRASDHLQDMAEANFEFYKRVTDDERFGKFFLDWLFEQYRESVESEAPGPKAPAVVERVAAVIAKELQPSKIILFGSGARGEMGSGSDLDLLVVLPDAENMHEATVQGYKALAPLHVPVDLLVVSEKDVDEWGHVIGHVINEALIDGRVVYDAA